ncbi:MAG: Lrp/AsnC family transcriptional regulator [Fidelibacterota bacterium]
MIDKVDRHIVAELQKNARMTASDIAREVGLSVPATAERIKRLMETGIIKRFTAQADAKKLGFDLTAFISVISASSEHYQETIDLALADARILECHSVTGEGSHLLKIRVRNSTELEQLLRDIQGWPGVIRSHTMLVLSTYKEGFSLGLEDE